MATRTISQQDLQNIMKQVHLYKRNTDKEIRLLKAEVAKLQKTVRNNIISEDKPDTYEDMAAKDFQSKRKKAGMKFVPLDSLG